MAPWLLSGLIGLACSGGDAPARSTARSEPVRIYPSTTIFTPARGRPRAAVVLLHGSEGGRAPYMPDTADKLAERGFVTASFCWYDCGGVSAPDKLQHVPLDRTLNFLRWFRKGPAKGLPVVLYGASRGAEHALLLGSLLGHAKLFEGIAAHGGSDTVVAAYDRATNKPISAVDGGFDAAWTWRGLLQYGERALPYGSGPRIAIEAYPGPIWLSHGEMDPLWPAIRSQRLADARKDHPKLETEVHLWAGQGHAIQADLYETAFFESLTSFIDAAVVSAR